MKKEFSYDVAVIGGGLGGLALSIQLARAGYSTILFEKEVYPFHRVCGEYISLESWNFLEELGLPLSDMNLPIVRQLMVSAPGGRTIRQALTLGGFGISRYKLDHELSRIAKRTGVTVADGTKVTDVQLHENYFTVQAATRNSQPGHIVYAAAVAGSFGKRSNLDVKWRRAFTLRKPNKLNNYIGIKYHIRTRHPPDLIALHNFSNGYCGISQVEDDKYCLCYLTTAGNLKRCGNSINRMEEKVLRRNPYLEKIFSSSEFLLEQPVTISQISFERKSPVEHGVLMVGDAAGMITPLCGNGMSMALHAAKLAFRQLDDFLQQRITRQEMETRYAADWKKHFAGRLRIGRFIQFFFGHTLLSNVLIAAVKPFPRVTGWLIRQTHGEPF